MNKVDTICVDLNKVVLNWQDLARAKRWYTTEISFDGLQYMLSLFVWHECTKV